MTGDIMALRAQIIDNLTILDNAKWDHLRFVLARDGPNGEWLVFLDFPGRKDYVPGMVDLQQVWHVGDETGHGATAELAYADLLGKTAEKVWKLYKLDDSTASGQS